MDMEEHMRNQIRQMISQNPSVLIGAGKKRAGRPRKMGSGVVESYSHLLADGMHKKKLNRKKNMSGGFAFLAPLLASALAPIAGKLVSKLIGNGRSGAGRSGAGRSGAGRSGAGVVESYSNLLADGMKKKRKSRKGGSLSPYQSLVKKVCSENGCGVREAAQHIKKNKLY